MSRLVSNSALISASALALLLAACASAPRRSEQLEQARAQVQTLSQEPLAQQAASQDLDAARKSLQQAEAAEQQQRPPVEVDHLAYLALRHAQAGEARVSEANARQEIARAQEERTQTLMQARTQEAQAARAQAQNAQAQAESARRQAQAAQSELAELQAKQTQRGMVVTLGDVLFDTGQATLKPGADLQLNRLAEYLKGNSNTRILIEGHTDDRGSAPYNQELSDRRAQAVATALESRGVAADQLQPVGRGKDFPVASNTTPEGRQQNRRVEIVFSDASGHFAQRANAPAQR
jgi:outer membrane protein OmpA-like peptidoglycan-associated protein